MAAKKTTVKKATAQRSYDDEVFATKRVPKGDVKFKIELNEEQKEAKTTIYNGDVTVLIGRAGSGKTLTACEVALSMLTKRQVKRIVVMRPTVAKKNTVLGFLPVGGVDLGMLVFLVAGGEGTGFSFATGGAVFLFGSNFLNIRRINYRTRCSRNTFGHYNIFSSVINTSLFIFLSYTCLV